jgi:hypothetical protein
VLRASLASRHMLLLMVVLVLALCGAVLGLHMHLPLTVGNVWDFPPFI